MNYRFDIEHRSDGFRVTACGMDANDERALARKLVNAGHPDGRIEGGRIGRVDWRVGSLHAFAATAISEGDYGLKVAPYKPHPNATVAPAL